MDDKNRIHKKQQQITNGFSQVEPVLIINLNVKTVPAGENFDIRKYRSMYLKMAVS